MSARSEIHAAEQCFAQSFGRDPAREDLDDERWLNNWLVSNRYTSGAYELHRRDRLVRLADRVRQVVEKKDAHAL